MPKTEESRVAGTFEFRAAAEGQPPKVAGYAAVFNQKADIGGYFFEQIAPGAFDDVMNDDVVFLVDHEGQPLARTSSGTLAISVDERGLFIEAELNAADPDVAALVPKLERGDLSKMSFVFRVGAEEWDETGDVPVRTITKLKRLRDVSVVTFPAYDQTEVALRSLEEHRSRSASGSASRTKQRMIMALQLQDLA